MDAVGFGFSCCCLQTTVQASNIQEAFIMYDNLAPLCPIMLALSAATPIFRGYLSDSDCRWNVLSQSADDRTEEERGIKNIQSTNWQFLRFKPPPPNSNIGWRVEFRPMEVQLSDFENAAYVVFIVLVTRVILTFKLNFLIPISKIEKNMVTAQKNDAARNGMFYFHKDVITANSLPEAAECVGCREVIKQQIDEEYTLMSINEIINGKDDFPGLIPLVNKYLEYSECDVDTRCTVLQYLQLISNRASGKLMTMAQWTRKFVLTHADYKQDSVVNENITYDLLVEWYLSLSWDLKVFLSLGDLDRSIFLSFPWPYSYTHWSSSVLESFCPS
ncbi:GCLC [Acanthosepion pharaonis]|uniref:Glutamate--cysteine ligase n=1 Tax=Acanthosepion pharaonis TaxID=158019 RepID=A0A812BUS9_ACAPH|nr:GCLC [Sepia pharaonis]